MELFGHELFSFEGRINRAPYIKIELLALVVASCVSLTGILATVALIAFMALHYSLSVRRLHDLDRSGLFAVLFVVPVIGFLLLIYLLVAKGTPGPNRYGEDLL